MADATETTYALDGQTVSAAAAKLTELAAQMDYHAAATGPGSFQLVRRRRKGVRRRTETMMLTFVEDRTGPQVRVIGDVDRLLLEHLTGRPDAHRPRAMAPVATDQSPAARVFATPAERHSLPEIDSRRVRPASGPSGLISAVPGTGGKPAAVPDRQHRVVASQRDPVPQARDVDGRTVMRPSTSSNASAPNGSTPAVVLPDGTTVSLATPVVVGRNPNPNAGGSTAAVASVADPSLSKSHFVVSAVGGQIVVHDLNSTNGTQILTADSVTECVPGADAVCSTVPAGIQAGQVRFEIVADDRTRS